MRCITFVILALALLTGCSSNSLLLSKAAPQPVAQDSLIHPPWETLVKAGPGAGRDVDLETLNGPEPAAPTQVAAAPTPPAARAPEPVPAAQPPKPGATAIKAVAVLAVDGPSPTANRELAAAMRKVLKDAGWPVLSNPRNDALSIRGHVELDAAQGPNQTVHISWQVASPKGKALGNVDQSNQVPAHSLDGAWGETAGFAAQAAAEGLFKLIGQYR